MNDKDFLFWLQGVLEVKVKFNSSKELEEILKDVKEHNEGGKIDVVGRSEQLISWEQYKNANWWDSEAIDVEKVLLKRFLEINSL